MQETILYDHKLKSMYSLDFEKWIKPFNDKSIFFQNWFKHILIASEQMEYRNSTDDCFRFPYSSNDVQLRIHFNIGHIYSQCEKHRLLLLHKEKVSLNFPVLCCYAPVQENNQLLVIDGNHRITIKKKLHIKSVNLFEYQLNSPLDFANDFEYLIFHFLLECNKPSQDRIINPAHKLSMPWLTTPKR